MNVLCTFSLSPVSTWKNPPFLPSSAFKHKQTKSRSLKKTDKALPNSPHKRNEIVKNLAKRYDIHIQLQEPILKGRKPTSLDEDEKQWIVSIYLVLYGKVLSGDVVIDTSKKFANEISSVDCLFLSKEQLLKEPEEVAKAAPIPTTLKLHKVKRVKEGNSFVNKFCYLSEDLEPFFTRKYGLKCGHKATDISDDNICKHCEDAYVVGEEWIQYPICTQ